MTTTRGPSGSPGSHRRNWQPGDDDREEPLLQKLADMLRDGKSEREIASLLDIPRALIWRAKLYAAIPQELCDRLLDARVGSKAMIYIGRLCANGTDNLPPVEIERCPHCGHQLRVRAKAIKRAIDIFNLWINDGKPTTRPEESDQR
jgi:hypothetical protein